MKTKGYSYKVGDGSVTVRTNLTGWDRHNTSILLRRLNDAIDKAGDPRLNSADESQFLYTSWFLDAVQLAEQSEGLGFNLPSNVASGDELLAGYISYLDMNVDAFDQFNNGIRTATTPPNKRELLPPEFLSEDEKKVSPSEPQEPNSRST